MPFHVWFIDGIRIKLHCGIGMDIYQTNFEKLEKLLPNLRNLPDAMKLKAPGHMDLNVDVLERKKLKLIIAMSHYQKHISGDLVPDPDMTMAVYFANKTVEALTYQDCFGYRQVYNNEMTAFSPLAKKDLNNFLGLWLNNLLEQKHQSTRP